MKYVSTMVLATVGAMFLAVEVFPERKCEALGISPGDGSIYTLAHEAFASGGFVFVMQTAMIVAVLVYLEDAHAKIRSLHAKIKELEPKQ